MQKIVAWAKSHKIAAGAIGCGGLIIVSLILMIGLGLILMATGYEVEEEPDEEVIAQTPDPDVTRKTQAPAPEPTTQAPEPAPTTEPAAEKTPATDAAPLTDKLEDVQAELDIWFDCTWQNTTIEARGLAAEMAMGACEAEGLGVIVSENDATIQVTLDEISKDNPGGGYFLEDGLAVWSPNKGTVNLAWDVLGTPGTPTNF